MINQVELRKMIFNPQREQTNFFFGMFHFTVKGGYTFQNKSYKVTEKRTFLENKSCQSCKEAK
jgi:hypothetical protein